MRRRAQTAAASKKKKRTSRRAARARDRPIVKPGLRPIKKSGADPNYEF